MPHTEAKKVRIGQIWSHAQDCTWWLVVGESGDEWSPWSMVVIRENPVLVQKYKLTGEYKMGFESTGAFGLGTPDNPAWYLVEEPYTCPECDSKANYIPDGDYICEVCRGEV